MKRLLLLLVLPALLAGCPKPKTAEDAVPAPAKPAEVADVASATATATPVEAPAAAAAKVEFSVPGTIRAAGTLSRSRWRLASATDANGRAIAALMPHPEKPVTLAFRGRRLEVANTCNGMGGDYTLGGGGSAIAIDKLASTRKACADPKLMALDQELGKRLQGKLGLRMSKGDARLLELKTTTGDVLVFTSEPVTAAGTNAEAKKQ